MATKYISWDTGNDSTGDGSLSTPWKTFAKALTGTPALASGDVLVVAPGIYRESGSTITLAPAAETIIRGDPHNKSGFAGVTVGPVILSAWTTNDTTGPAGTDLLTASGKDLFTFEDIWFMGERSCFDLTGCENWKLTRCFLFGRQISATIDVSCAVDTANNMMVRDCIIVAQASVVPAVDIDLPTSASADYDVAMLFDNCLLVGAYGIQVTASGVEASFGGGVDARNCTVYSQVRGFHAATAAKLSTAIPCTVYNSMFYGPTSLHASTEGQIVEDWNLLFGNTPRANISGANAGANSQTTAYCPHLEFGQSALWGLPPLHFMEPWPISRTVGFGNQAGFSTADILGRPRPSGSGRTAGSALPGVGCHELHDYGVKEATVKDAGDASLKLTGPGDHELLVPVDASATTISIKVRRDTATYDLGTRPSVVLLDTEGFANISGNTETETGSASCDDAWETLTFTAFTPSRKGVVRLRLVNANTAGDGICYFDTLSVA